MTRAHSLSLLALTLGLGLGSLAARGQALPAVTRTGGYIGFQLPDVPGTLSYSLSAGDSVTTGYEGTNQLSNSANVSGNLAFLSTGNNPFSMVYSGAYLFATTGQPNYYAQSLGLSQVYKTEHWNFVAADTVSYSPQSPSVGLAGIPGLGDQGLNPVATGDGIQSAYAPRVSNNTSVSAQRSITGSTSIYGTGTYTILRYTGAAAAYEIETNSTSGTVALNHRIDARDNAGVSAVYFENTYVGQSFNISSETIFFNFSRKISPRVTATVSIGPQRTTSNDTAVSPTFVSLAANAAVNYSGRVYQLNASFSRSTNGGQGIELGSETDGASGGISRSFFPGFNVRAGISYSNNTTLTPGLTTYPSYSTVDVTASAQYNKQLRPRVSAYASYYLTRQILQGGISSPSILNGLTQNFAVGITYAPEQHHIGHRN